ncbi:MAG: hypothetical protein J5849_03990 [Clostridia bacterium]|nr:hypothetical protein [Clostridia bacterium]
MKKTAIWILIALVLAVFAACGENGVIRDTASEKETAGASETAPLPGDTGPRSTGGTGSRREGAPASGPDTGTERESRTETGSETESESASETDMLSGIIGSFFDMTRDKMLEARGKGGEVPADQENSLSYGDRYAGFESESLYDFDENGRLVAISLQFGGEHTLEEIAGAVTRLNPEAVTQNGSTVWTEDEIVYTLSQGENGPVLTIKKGL